MELYRVVRNTANGIVYVEDNGGVPYRGKYGWGRLAVEQGVVVAGAEAHSAYVSACNYASQKCRARRGLSFVRRAFDDDAIIWREK